jgi:hypothetical protein
MKKILAFTLFLGLASIARGRVSTRVCLADGNTPLELADPNIPFVYRDIMVGTKLTIIVSSDAEGSLNARLAIIGEGQNRGLLSARDYNDTTLDWAGSRFPAAGNMARVWEWIDPDVQMIALESIYSPVAGDWFVIDYTAIGIGTCKVGFYDHSVSWVEPVYYLGFSHVPTRDFNNDAGVDFADYAVLVSYWLEPLCVDLDSCTGTDLDRNGIVDFNDLILFADYWLERSK